MIIALACMCIVTITIREVVIDSKISHQKFKGEGGDWVKDYLTGKYTIATYSYLYCFVNHLLANSL